ncbi:MULTISPECIES: HEAT repeat domain-containing protein [unclassified Coleofasciculus]|uniref:HEAT repeat domain-containing protein n=1 Tax=unclassified Coleofasciculus TaxID=2692782 RepID=UPI00187FAD14|nr:MULTISPECIES: HEAT repeat domain-containing protein [unclassified Coleofasciculus]MBE9129646.1 HEAT repeat domain-containing protein [Coleofasciculus sp. LEGE 07081]MBE9152168.1 HEAT repeat domain-containing protein [Coleofasciculus sp. LEGE 07092]
MSENSLQTIFRKIKEGMASTEWLRYEVDSNALVKALKEAPTDHARIILCDVLGWRHEKRAVPIIINMLENDSFKVRSSAADALAKIGDPTSGNALLHRLELPEPKISVRRMLLAALGAVDCQEAIPLLIEYLQNPDPSQRGSAAWSLGEMRATEALQKLENALRSERSQYPRERMIEAIRKIKE